MSGSRQGKKWTAPAIDGIGHWVQSRRSVCAVTCGSVPPGREHYRGRWDLLLRKHHKAPISSAVSGCRSKTRALRGSVRRPGSCPAVQGWDAAFTLTVNGCQASQLF